MRLRLKFLCNIFSKQYILSMCIGIALQNYVIMQKLISEVKIVLSDFTLFSYKFSIPNTSKSLRVLPDLKIDETSILRHVNEF
jgi:hypothetical protein